MESTLRFEAPFGGRSLSIVLFTDVNNIKDIIAGLKAGTIAPEAAYLDAAHVASIPLIQLAAYHALVHEANKSLKSRTLHSEIVYNISASNHIAEAYKRFGPTDHTTSLLIARVDATPQDLTAIRALVQGTEVAAEALGGLVAEEAVAKLYKITEPERSLGPLQDAIMGRIAVRDC